MTQQPRTDPAFNPPWQAVATRATTALAVAVAALILALVAFVIAVWY